MIKSVLDVDLYKLTMMQLAWVQHRNTNVEYEFINRAPSVRLADHINTYALNTQLDNAASLRFTDSDIAYLRSLGYFRGDFLDALKTWHPSPVHVGKNDGQITIWTEGVWWKSILWETMVMSIVSEMHNTRAVERLGCYLPEAFASGMIRLQRKMEQLQQSKDAPAFMDFGTRRRFSGDWQLAALAILKNQLDESVFLGTSNVFMAKHLGLQPLGTYAHELDMVYAATFDAQTEEEYAMAHRYMMRDWERLYPTLRTALTDTWGTDFFFKHSEMYAHWPALRQDSGYAGLFVFEAVDWWRKLGEDPANHTIVFSDGLHLEEVFTLQKKCDQWGTNAVFGIGTSLMNDVGITPLSIVMKATKVDGVPTVKLSNSKGKAMGPIPEWMRG